jgi:hypothetical protein
MVLAWFREYLEGSGLRIRALVVILVAVRRHDLATPSFRPNTRTPAPPLADERIWGERREVVPPDWAAAPDAREFSALRSRQNKQA